MLTKKIPITKFAFKPSSISRQNYIYRVSAAGYDALEDAACLELFVNYSKEKYGNGPETKWAYLRGYTIASEKERAQAKLYELKRTFLL